MTEMSNFKYVNSTMFYSDTFNCYFASQCLLCLKVRPKLLKVLSQTILKYKSMRKIVRIYAKNKRIDMFVIQYVEILSQP